MTKDIRYVVEEANKSLASEFMQTHDEARTHLCSFIDHVLLDKHMYHGFNYFVKKALPNGDETLCLAGKETNLIQFYVI